MALWMFRPLDLIQLVAREAYAVARARERLLLCGWFLVELPETLSALVAEVHSTELAPFFWQAEGPGKEGRAFGQGQRRCVLLA